MKPLHISAAVIALCILSAAVFGQNSSIEGIVFRAGSADALSKAQVELRSGANPNQVIDSITTESDGRFQFQNVRPGRYGLSAQRQGYFRPPLAITVVAGQSLANVRLSMTPAGAISGHIYDVNGEPLGNADVQALKALYPQGHRTLTFVQSAITNDLGEFRLFGLPPGRYYLAALHPEFQGGMSRSFRTFGGAIISPNLALSTHVVADPALGRPVPDEERDPQAERYVPFYFPGTPEELNASAIDLRPGTDFGGVNINVSPVRPKHVRGAVLDASGRPAQSGGVTSVAGAFDSPIGGDGSAAAVNGAFDLVLNPGKHFLVAHADGTGYATVRVENADIDGLTIRATAAFNIRGRIAVESRSGSKPDLSQLRVFFQPDYGFDGKLLEKPSVSIPQANGALTLNANSGDYRVGIVQLPPDLFVKSIRLGNADVLNAGVHLDGPTSSVLEIVLSTDYGVIDGNVSSESTFVLIPNVRNRTDLYRTTVTDPSGHFHLDQIPPGDYKMFAWSEVEEDAWYDPDFIRTFENDGKAIHVSEGGTEHVQLTAIAY